VSPAQRQKRVDILFEVWRRDASILIAILCDKLKPAISEHQSLLSPILECLEKEVNDSHVRLFNLNEVECGV
jgi:hypothetical protein